MKVLVLLTDLFGGVGGIQTYNRFFIRALSEILKKNEDEITVLALNDSKLDLKSSNSSFELEGIKYFSFNRSKLKFILSSLLNSFKASLIIVGHVNFSPLIIGIRWLNPLAKISLILHDIDIEKRLSSLKRFGLLLINKIFSNSAYTKRLAVNLEGINNIEIDVLPCTLESYKFKKLTYLTKEELGIPQGHLMLTVSRLDKESRFKKIDLVIESLPTILKQVPGMYYVIVGEGSDKVRLENLAKELEVDKNVIFAGYVSKELLSSYYSLCDLFILPSEKEGFGIVFLEAMYHEKPCIGARIGGIPEVVVHGETGFLIEPQNKNELTEYVIKLIKDKNLSFILGKAGKMRLEQNFSFDSFKKKLQYIL